MAADSFTTVTSTSIFGRTKNALIGFLLGPLLVIGAIILIFWNESRSVHMIRSLKEGAATVVEAQAEDVEAGHDGHLIHLTGETATEEKLHDQEFGLEASGVRLIRDVAIYEWTEKEASSKTSTSMAGTTIRACASGL